MITTKNLLIREFTLEDSEAYFENNRDGAVRKYMPNHSHENFDEARDEIRSFIDNYAGLKMPCHWAVVLADTGEMIGHVGIGDETTGENEKIFEICCGIKKEQRGNGYATEASSAFASWCKRAFGINKICASAQRENAAANKTLASAGFTLNGTGGGEEADNFYSI